MTITRNFSVLANGAGSANTLSLGGATLGTNALAVTGTMDVFRSTVGTYFTGGGGDNAARELAITSSTTTNSGDTHTFNAQSGTGILAFAITGTERARFNNDGSFAVGSTTSRGAGGVQVGTLYVGGSQSQGGTLSNFQASSWNTTIYECNATGANGAATAIAVAKNTSTSRSINAGGTVNASGADYAEYMTKADDCGVIVKGGIAGVNDDGKLTDKFADAHSFVVKSTDPSYVGGDVWGSVDIMGIPPEVTDPAYTQYAEKLEVERQKVDRIAFSGQVPVNVTGAKPGQFIDAADDGNGSIIGIVTDSQGINTVGRVWKILEDGRAFVKVL